MVVKSRAFLANSSNPSSSKRPASSFRADSGLGSTRRQRMTVRMCRSPRSGDQSRLRVLTQISPVAETLGWKILVRKYPGKGRETRDQMGFFRSTNGRFTFIAHNRPWRHAVLVEFTPMQGSRICSMEGCHACAQQRSQSPTRAPTRCQHRTTFGRHRRELWREDELHLEQPALKGSANWNDGTHGLLMREGCEQASAPCPTM